jgi:hypothetical protein
MGRLGIPICAICCEASTHRAEGVFVPDELKNVRVPDEDEACASPHMLFFHADSLVSFIMS